MKHSDGSIPANGARRELRHATTLIVAICLMVLGALAFGVAEIRIKVLEQAEAGFRLDAHVEASAVQADLTAAASAAETAGRFNVIAVGIDPIGFSGFLGGITVQYPWIAALEWVPKVDHRQRRAFIDVARQVLPGYQIREPNGQGLLVSAKPRPTYFPVTLVEPLTLESRVVGLDLGNNVAVGRVLDAATATGELRASEILTQTREIDKGYAIILAAPVYNDVPVRGLPPALWRLRNVRGFALAIVDVRRVLDHAVARAPGIPLTINIATVAPDAVVGSARPSFFTVTNQITLGGRLWWLTVQAPRATYLPPPVISWLALGAAVLVIAVVLVAGISVRAVVKRSILIRQLHLEMAAAAAFSRDILDTLREPVVIVDARDRIIKANRAWVDWQRSSGAADEGGDSDYLKLLLRADRLISKSHELALIPVPADRDSLWCCVVMAVVIHRGKPVGVCHGCCDWIA